MVSEPNTFGKRRRTVREQVEHERQLELDEQEHTRHQLAFAKLNDQSALREFYAWWLHDEHRSECTLRQAVSAYMQTFPGRTHSLMTELIENQT